MLSWVVCFVCKVRNKVKKVQIMAVKMGTRSAALVDEVTFWTVCLCHQMFKNDWTLVENTGLQ